jgi:hypothetical protein
MDQGCNLIVNSELCVASSDYVYSGPKQALSGTVLSDENLPVPIIGRQCTKKSCKQWIYVDVGDRMTSVARQANLTRDQFLEVNSKCFNRSKTAALELEDQLEAWHWYCVGV